MKNGRRMYENGGGGDFSVTQMVDSPSPSRSLPISCQTSPVGVCGGLNYIVHRVSKLDTLAGVAIKYGVEVADIKRLNGLVTDLQMFALKNLQIPLPGRHPPSPNLSNVHDPRDRPSSCHQTASSCSHSDLLGPFQSLKPKSSAERKISSAMSSLQGYYGLRPANQKAVEEGFEMAVYHKGGAHYLEDIELAKSSPSSNPPLSLHRKTKSVANGFMNDESNLTSPFLSKENEASSSYTWIEKLMRSDKNSEADLSCRAPEKLLKEENGSSSTISAITGKGLALRPKSSNRAVSGVVDGEAGGLSTGPFGSSESMFTDSMKGVRKSSSTSSLLEPDTSTLTSIWPTSKWSLKPDFQALSTAAITRPIPKPVGRRNKAALD